MVAVVALVSMLLPAGMSSAWGAGTKPATHHDFDRRHFSHPTTVDNQWLPLTPGTQYVLDGVADLGAGPLPHRVIFTVTDLTKVVDGVKTRVIWDQDLSDGKLVEAELAFHAQDDDGNVWLLGEYPEEYENRKFVGAPSTWMGGIQHAKPGVLMRADPKTNTSSYLQGFARAVGFADRAKVLKTGQKVCGPTGCYKNVLVIDEWSQFDPAGGHQLKYHAPRVGIVRVEAQADPQGEFLELTEIRHLDARALARADEKALKLDRHGVVASPDVYAKTPPAERQP